MENKIIVKNLNLRYSDGVESLTDVDLNIVANAVNVLFGPAGGGKSTLLRALAGLCPYGSGVIAVPEGARVMVVPQKPYIPHGPLRAAVAYPDPPEHHADADIVAVLHKTKLDVLAPFPELKVCVAYEDETGKRYDHVPYHQSVIHKVRPVYETLPGWNCEIDEVLKVVDLGAVGDKSNQVGQMGIQVFACAAAEKCFGIGVGEELHRSGMHLAGLCGGALAG